MTNKGLKSLTLHVMTYDSPFKLNYWNKWIFARYSNFLTLQSLKKKISNGI